MHAAQGATTVDTTLKCGVWQGVVGAGGGWAPSTWGEVSSIARNSSPSSPPFEGLGGGENGVVRLHLSILLPYDAVVPADMLGGGMQLGREPCYRLKGATTV